MEDGLGLRVEALEELESACLDTVLFEDAVHGRTSPGEPPCKVFRVDVGLLVEFKDAGGNPEGLSIGVDTSAYFDVLLRLRNFWCLQRLPLPLGMRSFKDFDLRAQHLVCFLQGSILD